MHDCDLLEAECLFRDADRRRDRRSVGTLDLDAEAFSLMKQDQVDLGALLR